MLEQVGILYENTHKLPLPKAIDAAVRQFISSEHCGEVHRAPEECRINPSDLRSLTKFGPTLYGMQLISDRKIPIGRIRICTATPEEEAEYEPLAA